jgi:hypothetical protein
VRDLPKDRRKAVSVLVVLFLLAAFAVYYNFFDILIPGMQSGDSYRLAVGQFFVIPIILLLLGQSMIAGFIFQLMSKALIPKKSDSIRSLLRAGYLRAWLIGAVMTFWFSLTYMIFPKYGPFYYVVFVYQAGPSYALPIEIIWTVAGVLIGTYLGKKFLNIPCKMSLLAAAAAYLIITVAAS